VTESLAAPRLEDKSDGRGVVIALGLESRIRLRRANGRLSQKGDTLESRP